MHFIFGANIRNSNTTGMGRQMHGLGDALEVLGHSVEYYFSDNIPTRLGVKMSRLEFPLRLAAQIRRRVGATSQKPIALLHEPIGWATAAFVRDRVQTISMVHNCESKVWRTKRDTSSLSGERISLSSRVLWPLTELSQSFASLRIANAVLCLSSEDLRYIVNELHVDGSRVHRIDNGLELQFLNLPVSDLSRERDILFLGHWLPHKGTTTFVNALNSLTARGVSASLTLAGTGFTESQILNCLPSEWRSKTQVLPHVSPDRLIDVYRRHQIFVLPSVWEGIPLAMLEAMACGLFPIVSNVGGVPDVIIDGKTGCLVPTLNGEALANAIADALRNSGRTRQLGRAAQTAVQDYGWARVAKQVESICGLL
jgi:glycosyltransferase involved in cell wall biosynthesis